MKSHGAVRPVRVQRRRRHGLGRSAGTHDAVREGRTWTLGTSQDVDWISRGTTVDRTITSAIPPTYDSYATVVGPEWSSDDTEDTFDRDLIELLGAHGPQSWWLGYLDTGADDVIFPSAARATLYADWRYVLVLAGLEQAIGWRESLPDLIFPTDHSWLLSTLWDDSWTCIGGPTQLIDALAAVHTFNARRVVPGEDATPPGHISI